MLHCAILKLGCVIVHPCTVKLGSDSTRKACLHWEQAIAADDDKRGRGSMKSHDGDAGIRRTLASSSGVA